MSKNKEELARRAGMDYALRMVKLHGIEWAEADLKKKGAYNIPLFLTEKDLREFEERTKMTCLDTVLIMSLVTLLDEFDFTKEQLNDFKRRFNLKAQTLSGGYETWQGMQDILLEECEMKEEIRNTEAMFHERIEDE